MGQCYYLKTIFEHSFYFFLKNAKNPNIIKLDKAPSFVETECPVCFKNKTNDLEENNLNELL